MLVQHVVLHREGAITLCVGTWSAKEGLYTGRGLDRVLVCGMLMRAYCIHREEPIHRVLVCRVLMRAYCIHKEEPIHRVLVCDVLKGPRQKGLYERGIY